DFSAGAVASIPSEKLPPSAFPRAFNTAFEPVAGGGMALRRRPGLRFAAQPEASAGAYVAGMSPFVHFDMGARAAHQVGVTSDGKVWELEDSGSMEIEIPTNAGEFPSDTFTGTRWRFAEANNCLFGVSGAESFKVYKKTGVNTLYLSAVGIP